jgi:Calx-beta domain-containing protein
MTVQFSASTASATETPNATTEVTLLVTRTGNTSASATVNYASSDATASERSDYLAGCGLLHFAAGETSKTISVYIVDDAFGEGPETFSLTLSNPTGVVLGAPTKTTITIHSDENVHGLNPVKEASFNSDFFVREHYLDFFNREPDPGGLAFWKNQIDECPTQACREIRKINVSAAFFLSIEFQQTGYLVERLYTVAYGSAVGTSTLGGMHQLPVPSVRLDEFLADTQQIGRGVVIGAPGADQLMEHNKQVLIAEFVLRARFTTAYPITMGAAQYVDTLNANAGGPLSQAERDQLVSDLISGMKTRAQVLKAIAEDPDLFAAESNRAFVLAQFFGYLRRNPNDAPDSDYTGYDFWLRKLNQFNGNFVNAEMVKAFNVSGEYQGRFGP